MRGMQLKGTSEILIECNCSGFDTFIVNVDIDFKNDVIMQFGYEYVLRK